MGTVVELKIPQGKVKILTISDIQWDKRYRDDMGDLDALAESIKEKGILQPITVSQISDTSFKLLAGERRITAASMAGLTKIPVLVRTTDGEIDEREVELLENVMRKDFTWDEEAKLIRDIDKLYKDKNIEWSGRKTAQLLDKGVATVARAIQLANAMEVIPELATMKTADDALKTIKGMESNAIIHELRSRQKDPNNIGIRSGVAAALKMADKNYHVGDTFKGLAELSANSSFSFIECDPPYGIDLTKTKAGHGEVGSTVNSYNEVPATEYKIFLHNLAIELYRVANPNSWLVFWYGPTWHTDVMNALRDSGWLVDDIPCIWAKTQGQTLQPEYYLARGYEPFFIARKGRPLIMHRGRLNVFNYQGVPGQEKYHPTERPVALIEDLLETFAPPGTKVLVPFLGSGATIRACYNQGLIVQGWDLNPEYKDKFMLKVEADARALLDIDDSTED